MNPQAVFDRLRPKDEHLDTMALERIWSKIVLDHSTEASEEFDPGDLEQIEQDGLPPLVIVGAATRPARRRLAVVGAVAVFMLGVGGFAASRFMRQSTSTVPGENSEVDQSTDTDASATDSVPTAPVVTSAPTSVIALVMPTLPDGLALVGANQPTVRLEPSPYQFRLYGSLVDPADPTRMIRVEYAASRGIAIPCHSFLSLPMPDGAVNYSATEWMNAATPIGGSTPFTIGAATGAYCTTATGLFQAGWFAGEIGVDLSAGSAITTTELVAFAQSLQQVAPGEIVEGRPSVDLISDPLPAGWTVLVSEDVPFTQHITETSWVASTAVAGADAGQLAVQSWIGADEQGLYAKHAPIEAERVTIRGHDGYQYISRQRGNHGPLEIQIWWPEAPGVVISVWATDLYERDALTALIEDMTPVDAAGYSTAVGSAITT